MGFEASVIPTPSQAGLILKYSIGIKEQTVDTNRLVFVEFRRIIIRKTENTLMFFLHLTNDWSIQSVSAKTLVLIQLLIFRINHLHNLNGVTTITTELIHYKPIKS